MVAQLTDHLLVLDRGTVCEQGPAATLITRPHHEVTRALVKPSTSLSETLDAHT